MSVMPSVASCSKGDRALNCAEYIDRIWPSHVGYNNQGITIHIDITPKPEIINPNQKKLSFLCVLDEKINTCEDL